MVQLTNDNYFSPEATKAYWSVSQFKAFNKCEARGLAETIGEYKQEETDALLIGSYVDAYFAGDLDRFIEEHQEQIMSKRGGGLLAKYQHANDMIDAVTRQPIMMEYLTGEKQVVKTANLFGVDWKIKMDVYVDGGPEAKIVDLKTVKDFSDIWDPSYGRRSWIEFWGYDIQGAIYQKVEQRATGRVEPLPFFIAAVTKEKHPDVKIIEIPQPVLDAALGMVEAKIERFDLIKSGDVDPIRCESCDYCRKTKRLIVPEVYEIEEAK